MNQKVYKTLEYDKIIHKLIDFASSEKGKALCRNLVPICDKQTIEEMQTETTDALTRIYRHGSLSFSGLYDIQPFLKRMEIGATLGTGELLSISSLLNVANRVKSYSRNKDAMNQKPAPDSDNANPEDDSYQKTLDSLQRRFDAIEPLTPLKKEIDRCILSEEEVSDDASPTLKHIRRTIQNTHNRIHEQLNSMVNSSTTKNMLQDSIVTMRNHRYCLPVKQEYKASFPGMVHDHSSSGSTAFIEPMAIVKLNNELTELSVKEQEEIEKILADLSNLAGNDVEALTTNLAVLTELDFIFAKAELAKCMKATMPIFNEDGHIHIKKARHPLIDAKKVVPIDVSLGKDYRLLIVTGPNTGGKTVSLKTVGLLTLMGQAGLHIPAFDHSELSIFEGVFADIGDEQSIEQSLSTFSSHMTNTVSIIKEANSRSLALFDELGAGTDPTEGAALAISILTDLLSKNVTTMATTHYSELKMFALETDNVENASCEFNVETLRPTYRLTIGIPGKSNAFAIAGKLGLSDSIIEGAKKLISGEEKRFEDVIRDLDDRRQTIQNEQEAITKYKDELARLQNQWMQKNEKLDRSKERILNKAHEEAREVLQAAKDYADESIRKFNKWMTDGAGNKEMERQREELRVKLTQTESNLVIQNDSRSVRKHKPTEFKLGDAVNVVSLGLRGTITTLPNERGEAMVQMGIFNSQVHIDDLELIEEPVITMPSYEKTSGGGMKMSKALSIQTEINLIGKKVDEAIPVLDKYLDDAYLSHLPQITIIHGRGTGALRNAVHAHLKKTNYVKSYRIGAFGEGDHGVTIVEFK